MHDSNPDLLLFDNPGSPCVRRVKITLLEKGLSYRSHVLNLAALEQRSPEYLAINPNGLVPTLVHDGFAIWESNVITEYLDDVFPGRQLYPQDLARRTEAKVWQQTELVLAKEFRAVMYQRMLGPLLRFASELDELLEHAKRATDDPAYWAWEEKVWRLEVLTPDEEALKVERLLSYLDTVEVRLRGNHHLLGDELTTADISMFPRVRMYPLAGLRFDPDRHPNIIAWTNRLERRKSFRRTLTGQARAMHFLHDSGLLALVRKAAAASDGGEPVLRPTERAVLFAARPLIRRALGFGRAASGSGDGRLSLPRPLSRQRPIRPAWFRGGTAAPSEVQILGDDDAAETEIVMAACRHLGLGYELGHVDMGMLEHRTTAFRQQAPSAELPVVLMRGSTALGMASILESLASLADRPEAIGVDAETRARFRMWLAFDAGLHKEIAPFFLREIVGPRIRARYHREPEYLAALPEGLDATERAFARRLWSRNVRIDMDDVGARSVMASKLQKLEGHLAASDFIASPDATLADLALAFRVVRLERYGFDWNKDSYPSIRGWIARVAAAFGLHESFRAVAA